MHNGILPFPHDEKYSVSSNQESKYVCGLFFDIRGIVYYEILPRGQTVNQFYYLELLERLREKVIRKRPEYFGNNS